MYRSSICCAVAFALAVGFTGCSGDAGPTVQYVEGVVTLDGEAIEGVTVGFSPVDVQEGIAATGTTDSNGVYKLTSSQGGKPDQGAVAGEYTVTFRKVKGTFAEALTPDDPGYEKSMASGKEESAPALEYVVPARYGNPADSEFKVTVKSGKNTGDDFKFALTSDE